MSEINNATRGTENPENCGGCGTSSESGLAGSIPANGYTVKKEHLVLLAGALLLGFLANVLFFDSEPGVSVPIFVLAFYVMLYFSCRGSIVFKPGMPLALTIPVILLSLTYLLYSNMIFRALNFIAIPVLITAQAVLITGNNTYSWHTPGFLIDIIYGFTYRILAFIFKPFNVATSWIVRNRKQNNAGKGTIRKVLLGLLVSVPLLLIVVSLLVSADRVFESYVKSLFDIFRGVNLGEFIGRAVFIAFIFLTSFSFLYSLIESRKPAASMEGDGSVKLLKTWDHVVVITIMAAVNTVYLLFVIIQFAYLFGGVTFALPEGFTYSEYARRGFFELIAVTAINFGLTLLFIGFTKVKGRTAAAFLRGLYILLVGNTAVMLVSAYYRMLLYEDAYGFTYLRVLTQAFMIFMLVLFGIMLLRIWKDGFSLAKPFIAVSVAAFVIVNYINVDVIIARNNIQRYHTTNKIDVNYLSVLSYDALPEIAKFKPGDEKVAADIEALVREKSERALERNNWQSFNVSHFKAGRLAAGKRQ